MQVKVGKLHGPRDCVGWRRRTGAAKADRLMPAHGVRQRTVIVIGAGIAADPDHRQRSEIVAAGEQVDFARSGFQRNGSRIERRRGAAQHGNRLAAQRLEIDPLRRVRVAGLRHVLRQHIRHIGAAAAGKAACQDRASLWSRPWSPRPSPDAAADGRPPARCERALCHSELETPDQLAIPVEIGGPIQPRNPIERIIGRRAVARFVPRLEAQGRAIPAQDRANSSASAIYACARSSATRRPWRRPAPHR